MELAFKLAAPALILAVHIPEAYALKSLQQSERSAVP